MKKSAFVLVLIGVLLLMLVGCSTAADPREVNPKLEVGKVVDFGNGVYYFNSKQADFANALSAFLSAHQELEVTSMAGDGTCGYGADCGYFVTFRHK